MFFAVLVKSKINIVIQRAINGPFSFYIFQHNVYRSTIMSAFGPESNQVKLVKLKQELELIKNQINQLKNERSTMGINNSIALEGLADTSEKIRRITFRLYDNESPDEMRQIEETKITLRVCQAEFLIQHNQYNQMLHDLDSRIHSLEKSGKILENKIQDIENFEKHISDAPRYLQSLTGIHWKRDRDFEGCFISERIDSNHFLNKLHRNLDSLFGREASKTFYCNFSRTSFQILIPELTVTRRMADNTQIFDIIPPKRRFSI